MWLKSLFNYDKFNIYYLFQNQNILQHNGQKYWILKNGELPSGPFSRWLTSTNQILARGFKHEKG